MSRPPWLAAFAICLALLGAAFVAAPKPCEQGLNFYALCGTGAAVLLFVVAFAAGEEVAVGVRFLRALGFVALGAGAWVAWVFVANIRIMCRLF